jgi:hypothetical protein
LRFALGAQGRQNGNIGMQMQMTHIKQKLGESTFYFSSFNPTGKYKLKLDDPIQRQVAKNIIFLNKNANKRIAAKEMADRS